MFRCISPSHSFLLICFYWFKTVHLQINIFKSVNLVKKPQAMKTKFQHYSLLYFLGIILSMTNITTTYLFHYLLANMLVVFRWPIKLIRECTELQCRENNYHKFKRILWYNAYASYVVVEITHLTISIARYFDFT